MALPTIITLNWRLDMQNFAQLAGEIDNLKRKVIKNSNTYILRSGCVKAKTWFVKHKSKESNLCSLSLGLNIVDSFKIYKTRPHSILS